MIKNSDMTIGYTRRLNQFEMNPHLLGNYNYFTNLSSGSSTYKKDLKKLEESLVLSDHKEVNVNIPIVFNEKIQIFQFSPPSDNLWNIEIRLTDREGTTGAATTNKNLLQLYKNIMSVNNKWADSNTQHWQVSLKNVSTTS